MNPDNLLPSGKFDSKRVAIATVLDSDCRFIYELWASVRGNNFAPRWEDFDLQSLPPQAIPYTWVVDILDDPFTLKYRFWGSGLVEVLGAERTGKEISDSSVHRNKEAEKEYKTVIREKAPFAMIYNAKTKIPETLFYAPAIRLPLSEDGKTVDKIVSFTDFNVESEKWAALYLDGNSDEK